MSSLAAAPVPCPALIRRQHQRELKANDDICLTEEMQREGPVGRGGPRRPDCSAGQHSRTATGPVGVGEAHPLVHLRIPASKLTLMASRQVGTKGHFWRL